MTATRHIGLLTVGDREGGRAGRLTMRRATLVLLAAAVVLPTQARAQPGCIAGSRSFARLADLPAGAAGALGFRIAERGQPFQVTDVIAPGPPLPGARFIAARQQGCRLAIRFERGGIAHTYHESLLERRGNAWVVLVRDRLSKPVTR